MEPADENNKCRACLTVEALQLFDWNVDMLENLTYMNCFRQCTQLEELADEPTMLCDNCASELKSTYNFIQKTRESDRKLRLQQELVYTTEESPLDKLELKWVTMTDAKNLNSPVQMSNGTNDVDNLQSQSKSTTVDSNSLPLDDGDKSEVKCKTKQTEDKSVKATKRTRRCRSRKESPDQLSDPIGTITQDIAESLPKKPLKRHIREQKQKLHLCHICSRTFYDSRTLRRHTLTHEENRERNYSCDQCGRKFLTQNSCQSHAKTHNSNRQPQFQCDQCEKSFFHMGSLNIHKKQHTGNTLECQICQKRYLRSIDLEIHLRSHSGVTPYKCPHCKLAFTHVGNLNKHVRNHEGYKYKCDICEKEYTNKMTLNNHRMQHTGLPLKCAMCGKGFVEKSKMRVHIGGVHKVKDTEEMDKLIIKVKTRRVYRGRILEAC